MSNTEVQYGKIMDIHSVHEGVIISTKQEYEVSQYSTRETMLKDIIDALAVITSGDTNKLELCVNLDDKGRYRIVRKWRVL